MCKVNTSKSDNRRQDKTVIGMSRQSVTGSHALRVTSVLFNMVVLLMSNVHYVFQC